MHELASLAITRVCQPTHVVSIVTLNRTMRKPFAVPLRAKLANFVRTMAVGGDETLTARARSVFVGFVAVGRARRLLPSAEPITDRYALGVGNDNGHAIIGGVNGDWKRRIMDSRDRQREVH